MSARKRRRVRVLLLPANEHGMRVRRMMDRRQAWLGVLRDPPTDVKESTLNAWRRRLAVADEELTVAVAVMEAAGYELEEQWS